MKKITLLILLLITSYSFGQETDLYISMYGEGSSHNKFIEIYNGTGDGVDLSGYSLVRYTNGSSTASATEEFEEAPVLASGESILLYHGSAAAEITDGENVISMESSVIDFNGDDAIALYNGEDLIDLMGEIGVDPGAGWSVGSTAEGTKDHTLIRKSTVCSGNAEALGSFGTDDETSEWEVYGQNEQWTAIGTYAGCEDMGTNDLKGISFVMYPNPTNTGKVHIETKDGTSKNIVVFDILGKRIISKRIENDLDVSGLKTGVYLVQVSQNGQTVTKKLIVE